MNQTDTKIEVVEPIRRSIIVLAIRMFVVLFFADTLYAGLIAVLASGYVPIEWHASYIGFLWLVHTLKNILLAYALITLVTGWISTLYYVTAGHLMRQRGVLNTSETVFQLTDIESVAMNQSWLGRLFNFGDVIISFSIAQQREKVLLYAINNPKRYEQLFSKFV